LKTAHLANSFLRTALDQASEGIMIVEANLSHRLGPRILLHNTRMAAMVGAEPENGLRERFVTQLVASQREADELMQALRGAVKQGGASQWEGGLKTLFGNGVQRCAWRIRAVQDEHGSVYNYTLTLALAQPTPAALSHSGPGVVEVDDSRRLRNDNLATLSLGVFHDLNNLLGIMMTNLSEAARLSPGVAAGEVGHHVDEALAASQQARAFIQQTMKMAKDMPQSKEPVDMADLVRETARVAQSGSGVTLHMHLPKDLWWAVVDAPKVTQVLQNLIINAIQAMNDHGFMDVLARNVVVPPGHHQLQPGPHVEVLVRDRGCGMEPEVARKVFNESFTTKQEGNGIGLTTCHRIILEHGGHIVASSMKNVGTEITFWLPATQPRTQTVPPKPVNRSLQSGVGTVLVVDDENRLRQVILAVLKQCGYKVFEAVSGEAAVSTYRSLLLQNEQVDVVIMDLTLKGGLNGEEAMRSIKAMDPAARVIASSGGMVEEAKETYLCQGFDDILPKPYLAPDVSAVVHRVLHEGKKAMAAA
jgi:signal transduction histidine kinase/ActR/RegA family two-component response regulator